MRAQTCRPDIPQKQVSDLVAIVLVFAAGWLHLWLTPEHFEESVLFGVVFLAIALFQIGFAVALWLRPAHPVRRVGRWGNFVVVAIFLGTRIVPPPGGRGVPETIEGPEGLLSLLLQLGAVAVLAVVLPMRPGGRAGFPRWTATGIGGTYFVLQLIGTGAVSYAPEPSSTFFAARFLALEGGFPNLSPALALLVGYHWSLYLPVIPTALVGVVAALLAIAVGLTIQLSRLRAGFGTRAGLLGALPATLAAPVCCGPSLLAAAGVGLVGLFLSLAVPLLGLSGILLLVDIAWLKRQLRRAARAGQAV